MFGVGLAGLRRVLLAVVVVTVGLLGAGGVARAALTDKRGAFHGCVGKSGVLRVIAPGRRCKRGQHAISFNQRGLRGATGPPAAADQINALENRVADLQSANAALTNRVGVLEGTLAGVTRSANTLRFTGMNLQLLSGTGATDATPNGLGNLIIGYDESPGAQTGSHNLILGTDQTFTSYGGILAGQNNTISAAYASVTGGASNVASGTWGAVTGGAFNSATGSEDTVTGGFENRASGFADAILGGSNQALAANSRCGTIPVGGAACP